MQHKEEGTMNRNRLGIAGADVVIPTSRAEYDGAQVKRWWRALTITVLSLPRDVHHTVLQMQRIIMAVIMKVANSVQMYKCKYGCS